MFCGWNLDFWIAKVLPIENRFFYTTFYWHRLMAINWDTHKCSCNLKRINRIDFSHFKGKLSSHEPEPKWYENVPCAYPWFYDFDEILIVIYPAKEENANRYQSTVRRWLNWVNYLSQCLMNWTRSLGLSLLNSTILSITSLYSSRLDAIAWPLR